MSTRIVNHILFWLAFIMLYVILNMLFVSPSDEVYSFSHKLIRFFLKELAFLPWKILPFYILFYYLIPKYFPKSEYLKLGLLFLGVIIVCLLAYRSVVAPVTMAMYGEQPVFNVYSIKRILFSLTDILPAVALASSVKLLKANILSRQKEKALEKEKLASELNFLKAQTNPHFLFNTLNNLYGLARRNDKNTAPSIMKLSNIMRYILYDCSAPTIPIENEVGIIEDYIQLEKLRYDDRLKVSFEKSVDNWKKEIAPLILLPFVENAFKHGASENRIDTFIDITLELKGNSLKFSIRNTSDAEDSNLDEGIGMKNVKRQLDLIYGKDYILEVIPEQGAFTVNLLIYPDQNVTK